MAEDVGGELAEALRELWAPGDPSDIDVAAAAIDAADALLPTVQALIADAEKRAAAKALRDAAEACRRIGVPGQARAFDAHAYALDPSGAAEGTGR